MLYLAFQGNVPRVSRIGTTGHEFSLMDFLLWAARAMHVFSAVMWLGGAMYQAVIVLPGLNSEEAHHRSLQQARAFVPFMWTGLMTVLVTGIGLMLFDPRFVFFAYPDWWSAGLGLKQLAFTLMMFFSLGYSRMAARLSEVESTSDDRSMDAFAGRLIQFNRYVIFLGVGVLLIAASMNRN